MKKTIQQFKKEGITLLEKLQEKETAKMVEEANKQYFNETPILTDTEYDILKEYVERKYPNNPVLKKIGSTITAEKNKIKLPYEMASMNKIKPDTEALTAWKRRFSGPYVVSCKLDGVSGLYIHNQDGNCVKQQLMTRGDGKIGQDISHLLPLLNLPVIPVGSAVRGEFILPKKIFQEKYSSSFANARNLVSGIINAKKIETEKIKDLHFVVYELITPVLKPSEQLKWISENRLETVQYSSTGSLSNDVLSQTLVEWRKSYIYEMDGLVITQDAVVSRSSGNPEHAFAFKMALSENYAEAKVVDVIWTPSKDGYLKPRVRIEPVRLSGTTIEYATGFNAKFIKDNRIGIGAIIQITRSGDVIPFIQSVINPAEYTKMPPVEMGETEWTTSGVDLVLKKGENNRIVTEKNITAFFTYFKVESLSTGNVSKLYGAGYDTIEKILKMSVEDFKKIDGFQNTLSVKIWNSIQEQVSKATLLDWIIASGKMGRGLGKKKLALILETYPDIIKNNGQTDAEKITLLQKITGIGPENAKEFVKGIPSFISFMENITGIPSNEVHSIEENTPVDKYYGKLTGKKIVMSKIRDKRILGEMKKQGAVFEERVNKNTFVLIVPSKDEISNKIKDAQKYGIPIMDPTEFIEKYLS